MGSGVSLPSWRNLSLTSKETEVHANEGNKAVDVDVGDTTRMCVCLLRLATEGIIAFVEDATTASRESLNRIGTSARPPISGQTSFVPRGDPLRC